MYKQIPKILTCDLDQKIKTSPTILNSSSASGSGQVSHLALHKHTMINTNLSILYNSL